MAKLKSERHHWWPECVSEHWADSEGGVNWLLPDGEVRRSTPNNFGVIGNGHLIKLSNDPSIPSPWDESFEAEFNRADTNFPQIIDWLNALDRCDPPFDRPIATRIMPQPVADEQFELLIECLVSLAARSPMYREQGAALAEHIEGLLSEPVRNRIIGRNIQHALQNAVRDIGGGGKAMVIYSPEREFICGDGFFQNLTAQGQHWHHPKMLVPLTPYLSVLFTRPAYYTSHPKVVTLVVSAEEAEELNFAVQVYARNAIYFRSERPTINEAFSCGRHRMFKDHRNVVDELIYEIPGTPPKDPNLGAIVDFFEEHGDN